MNRNFFSPEYRAPVDFLDERVNVSVEMTKEAFANLPEINQNDLTTKRERYRLMCGRWDVLGDNEVRVVIEAVLEMPNQPIYYTETKNRIRGVNLPAINEAIDQLRRMRPEYRHLELVGDFHTHLNTQDEELTPHGRPWHPSQGDIESIALSYESGILKTSHPFLFGIAGPFEGGQTGYSFYRIIKNAKGYDFRRVEWKGA